MPSSFDHQVRVAAFQFLEEQTVLHGEIVSWQTMVQGFQFQGQRVVLASQQGIFKPRILSDYPLSIRTTAPTTRRPRPYDDGFQSDETVIYKYRGTDPGFFQNVWLRNAMRDHIPLIYFHGTAEGRYIASWPAYVIGDNPSRLEFQINVDGQMLREAPADHVAEPDLTRRYGQRTTRQRLHQQAFRERVLRAYRKHCAVCRLRHTELLDAAHIIPDANPEGEPRVSNGISFCKLHHAAYDGNLFGVRPDYVIEVRGDILGERDGPMLQHGLQEIHDSKILLPGKPEWQPDLSALEQRFAEFRNL